jgi:thiamine biosynthesis lipoprotein
MKTIKTRAVLLAGAYLLVGFPCRAAEPMLERFTFTEPHMGTQFRMVLYAVDTATANRAAKSAFERIAELDGIMSDYKSTSELMRLCQKAVGVQVCQKAGGEPVKVSEDLWIVLEKAQEVARKSDGAFDVTVGPVVRLWRLARRTQQLPDPEKLAQAKALVGYEKMKLDPKARTVQLEKPGMQLDLGGIAKGYAADCAQTVLKKFGIERALVAAGGDIAVSGPPPGTEGWTIGIEALAGPDAKPTRFMLLKNAGVSTSGDSQQYTVIDGKRYSHIVDPKTGLGLVGRMTVTVVAPNGLTSDPMTKTVCVLGPEKGMAIIEGTEGVAALMVRKTDSGEEAIRSKRFKDIPQKKEP